jgi:D-alanine-D-alanine ligase
MEREENPMSHSAMDRVSSSNRPLSIVVLLGGWSAEREVSLASGRAVIQALHSLGHDVRELDPTAIDVPTYPWGGIDAAFIALHGSFGEDGTLQSLLDDMRVVYTGSGAEASRLAMDKAASKARFVAEGLPTPSHHIAAVRDSHAAIADKAQSLGYPIVVKPNAQGSSIGVSIVTDPAELCDALDKAFQYDPRVILETYIRGRELTVAVLERRPLPAIEVRSGRAFYDYRAKYHDNETQYVFETDLPPAVVRHSEALAVSAVQSLGCKGITRVDIRLDEQNCPWLLEVNTIPGFTDHSLVPKAAARAGIGFAQLCEQLVISSLQPALGKYDRAA